MTSLPIVTPKCQWFSRLASTLDRRSAPRLVLLFLGAVPAVGRRTVTTWVRALVLNAQFRPCHTTVAAAIKNADAIAFRLLIKRVKPLLGASGLTTFALANTPTERYGQFVQGAGIHLNPTPGPADSYH